MLSFEQPGPGVQVPFNEFPPFLLMETIYLTSFASLYEEALLKWKQIFPLRIDLIEWEAKQENMRVIPHSILHILRNISH